jgi:acetylglutamate kinase
MALENTTVIKFGGEIVDNTTDLNNLLDSVKQLQHMGEDIILVHGGGPRASKLSKKLGIEPHKIGGRRVTDKETLDVMKMALPGLINSDILCMMKEKKIKATSLSGVSLFHTKKRPPLIISGSQGKMVDFGYVGDVYGVDIDLLSLFVNNKVIPVISPLCCDNSGMGLNINADAVATSLALHINAKRLVLITKIGGVFKDINDPDSKISSLTIRQAQQCIKDKIIQDGMIPKIEECFKLLDHGLKQVHIVGTQNSETLLNEIKTAGSEGTVIIP